jgi:hypothetical protein
MGDFDFSRSGEKTMAFLKARPEEIEMVREAAGRIAHRTHSRFVLKQETSEAGHSDARDSAADALRGESDPVNRGVRGR